MSLLGAQCAISAPSLPPPCRRSRARGSEVRFSLQLRREPFPSLGSSLERPGSCSRRGHRRCMASPTAASMNSPTTEAAEVSHIVLGIDVGGTSIKGAPVDTREGVLLAERKVLPTPQPATPEAVAAVIGEMAAHFKWTGAVGIGLPSVVQNGIVRTAANVDKGWIGTNAEKLFGEATGLRAVACNDADAAGYAEMAFGAGRGNRGLVYVATFGTGIGTAMFVDRILVPNLELGHLELNGRGDAEKYAGGVQRELLNLSWEEWAARANEYLSLVEALFWPDLIIVGGGVSGSSEKWIPLLNLPAKTPVVAAEMRNDAGIVGAAIGARARLVSSLVEFPTVEIVR